MSHWTEIERFRQAYAKPGMTKPAAPGYDRITDAIADVLDSTCMTIMLTQDGHTVPLQSLARALDKAGLIDWATFQPQREPPPPLRRAARITLGVLVAIPVLWCLIIGAAVTIQLAVWWLG